VTVKYLGTGGTEGIPALFCACTICSEARKNGGRDVRRRACAVINGRLLVDLPPDLFCMAVEYGIDTPALGGMLLTHAHGDHFYTDELRHLSGSMPVFGNAAVGEQLMKAAREGGYADKIYFSVLAPYVPADALGFRVTPLKARHDLGAYVYIIEDSSRCMLYGNDSGFFPEETWDRLPGNKFDLVSLDCGNMGGRDNTSHMTLEDNLTVRKRLYQIGCLKHGTKFVCTHFSHTSLSRHDEIAGLLRTHSITAAYDGMEVTV